MNFGFANDKSKLQAAHEYREAAKVDGWDCQPTYGGSETVDRAATLKRDGFTMMVISRDNEHKKQKWKYEATIHIWGPDGKAIEPPQQYDFEKIVAGLRYCHACKASDVVTHRYGFAGRCCNECLPAMRAKHEQRGWDN